MSIRRTFGVIRPFVGCTWNTVSTYMRRIRCVYNMAVEEGLAPYIPYLFKGVFTGIESKRKKALPQDLLRSLMTASLDDPELRKTRQALCLMFQFCGIAFVDFAHLKKENVQGVGFWNINARKRVLRCL